FTPMTAEAWAAGFQQAYGREATMSEYQAAVAAGHVRKPVDPTVQQMTAGAKQFATGAKDFFVGQVAPTAAGAVRNVQHAVSEQTAAQRTGTATWMSWAPFAILATGLLMILSLLLPVANIGGHTINYFAGEVAQEGVLLLIGLLVVIAAGVLAIVLRKRWATITAAVLAIIMGILGIVDGFGTAANLNGLGSSYVSAGVGVFLLGFFGLALIAAAVLSLLLLRAPRPPANAAFPVATAPGGLPMMHAQQHPQQHQFQQPQPQHPGQQAQPAQQPGAPGQPSATSATPATPTTPTTPGTPATPTTPGTPATPETPETSATPGSPTTPESGSAPNGSGAE
ncbi:hypothetical protein OOT08_01145, partial [Leucobacter sp. M11]|nr:hypothetical protein [Leucobacter sp. M11]